MNPLSVVIVEDEQKSREVLRQMLESFCPEVRVVGAAANVQEGLKAIQTLRPDILLLDIEMQQSTGFDLLQQLDRHDLEVIFTTAYEQYALKAIKFSALDYLLKPIDINDLKAAITKAVEKRRSSGTNESLATLINNLKPKRAPRLTISTADTVAFIEVDQIIRCEAHGAYTSFHLKDGSKMLASKNLKEYETLLSSHDFFRVHHSHLINMLEVRRLIKADGGSVEMQDGSKVGIAQNRKEDFMARMKSGF
jgi:two-component system LytT family response regulator